MPLLQVADETARKAHTAALQRSSKLSSLQQRHEEAKARARKICRNEPGVISIYDLGEVIAEIEDEAMQAMAALKISSAFTAAKIADRLKKLLPV